MSMMRVGVDSPIEALSPQFCGQEGGKFFYEWGSAEFLLEAVPYLPEKYQLWEVAECGAQYSLKEYCAPNPDGTTVWVVGTGTWFLPGAELGPCGHSIRETVCRQLWSDGIEDLTCKARVAVPYTPTDV